MALLECVCVCVRGVLAVAAPAVSVTHGTPVTSRDRSLHVHYGGSVRSADPTRRSRPVIDPSVLGGSGL